MTNDFPKGSEWRKWDLHVHTPLSIYQKYGENNEATWEAYIKDLESLSKDFSVIGVNDYLFLDGYERLKKELEQTQGLAYIIDSKGVKNSRPQTAVQDDLLKRRVNFTYNKGAISSTLLKMDQFEPLDYAVEPDFQVIIGFDDAYIAQREVMYQAERREFLWLMSIFVVSLILAAICTLLACVSAGRKKDRQGVQLLPIDAFWIDAHFLLLVMVETLVVAAIVFFL